MKFPDNGLNEKSIITVQGGIGNNGEIRRLLEDFKLDRAGLASPFLLVPEATCIDEPTVELLKKAGKDELYLSGVSPIGVPFNNLKNSGSEICTKERIKKGAPG